MSILVVGGTGTVGSRTVRRLVERGEAVKVMSRSPERLERLPPGAVGVTGDLGEPASLPAALAGADRLCLVTPLSQTETEEGLAAVTAARRAGVRRLAFMSIHRAEECAAAPHFQSKIDLEQAIAASGIAYTFVRPNSFFHNDLFFRDALVEHGLYPQPLGGVGLHRVDVRDIADALAAALVEPGHDGESYALVGPDLLTGEATAEIWGRHLGRPVAYAGDDLDAWAEAARQGLPEWLVDDFKIMYRCFQRQGLVATAEDFDRQRRILGHPPRRFDDFVAETARAWKAG